MDRPDVSIIVVSRDRPLDLSRCLMAISQLDYPSYEVVVVTCPKGEAALAETPLGADIKLVPYDEPNISAARNRGISQSAGELLAFIDDDAVPEPNWLTWLTLPFTEPTVAAAGGTVLGRNGISVQWSAASIDRSGNSKSLPLSSQDAVVLSPTEEWAIKTEGTNMAFRRDVVAELGGFDPLFRYFLDETDLNMRIGKAGYLTAFVPRAVVHHGFRKSAYRRSNRVPRDLTQIGFSKEVFLRKHCPDWNRKAAQRSFIEEQRLRLLKLMQAGAVTPDDVALLMRGLRRGMADGQNVDFVKVAALPRAAKGFQPFPGKPGAERVTLSGSLLKTRQLRRHAKEAVAQGKIVSVYRFSRTAFYHKLDFTKDGYWFQRGGLFGKSLRTDRMLKFWKSERRVEREHARVSDWRDPL